MKYSVFYLLFLFFIGCKEPRKLSVYKVFINYDELNLTGNGYVVETIKDTIHSLNDSTAYVKALFKAEARQRANNAYSQTRLGEAKVYYFYIQDSVGDHLGDKLGVLKIDEINSSISNVEQVTKDKFLYPN